MSNPVVTIDNNIPVPADPEVKRITYTKIAYDAEKFWVYAENEYDPSYSTFDPANKGDEFFMFVPMDNVLGSGGMPPGVKPDFVSSTAWGGSVAGEGGLRRSASGFVTAVNSVMPKIIIPTDILVDNGIVMPNQTLTAAYLPNLEGLFNWDLISLNGTGIGTTETFAYAQTGAYYGSLYVSSKAKDDLTTSNVMVMELQNPFTPSGPPLGSAHDWLKADSSNLVVGGAFVLMLNVVPSRPASADPQYIMQNKWSFIIEFGEVRMNMDDTGSTEVTIGIGSASNQLNKTTVNLAEGKTKGGPPQQQHIDDKTPYIILIYPVWNGIVIASGIQDAYATVFSSSYYVPKLKEAGIFVPPYSTGFDPQAPAEVLVGTGTGVTDVMVDFGDLLTVTGQNCRFDIAYQPCFFSKQMWFDEWRLDPDDVAGVVTYEYEVFPIWTKNNTPSVLDPVPTVQDSGVPGSIDLTHYDYTQWRLASDAANPHFNRSAAEILGSILKTTETREFPIKNGNGNFDVVFSADKAGDPDSTGDWKDYVQNVSVTVNLDGSSGQITVDKFGVAGQDAMADQSIGAITIAVSGGYGTQSGTIFKGLGMGISENRTTEGAMWTIPLVGLEKKLDDIALINVPFFDGETFAVVGDFLSKYAGLIADYSNADTSVQLGVTDDINAVRFDWKIGTTVRAALQEVMDDIVHHYVVRDGFIFFYQLDEITGLPMTLGTDWKPTYPSGTKIVMYDAAPDFEDVRNVIVVAGLEQIKDGQNKTVNDLPLEPRMVTRNDIVTTPDIPWARVMVRPIPGYLDMTRFNELADKLVAQFSVYELLGKTTIPGNANIKPYDQWGEFVIYGVTHNIDLKSKVWTTDLEFMRKTS